MESFGHRPALLREAVEALVTDPDGFYIDGTFGRGGHSREILRRLSPRGRLLGIDKDPAAIEAGRELQGEDGRLIMLNQCFTGLEKWVAEQGRRGKVRGVLLDLGLSSAQLDDPRRGFSFSQDGPLDMRMNQQQGLSARQWLASAAEGEIARVLRTYGEERFARRIAKALVKARAEREIATTSQLAALVKQANPAWERRKHPATRVFQALRIAVNNELDNLEKVLPDILNVLQVGGRMALISFHSLEDRLVKRFMRDQERGDAFPPDLPVSQAQLRPRLRRIGKAIRAGADELAENVRARGAVLRVAEKISQPARDSH